MLHRAPNILALDALTIADLQRGSKIKSITVRPALGKEGPSQIRYAPVANGCPIFSAIEPDNLLSVCQGTDKKLLDGCGCRGGNGLLELTVSDALDESLPFPR